MHLCRFDDDKLGLVGGDVVCDVTEALDIVPTVRWLRDAPIGIPRRRPTTSMSACATSSPDGTKWQGAAHNGSPVTLSMENSVCCASNACP